MLAMGALSGPRRSGAEGHFLRPSKLVMLAGTNGQRDEAQGHYQNAGATERPFADRGAFFYVCRLFSLDWRHWPQAGVHA